jgi:hypothetical protein
MEAMKIHVLERALTAACIVAAIAVVWWGFKILAAWLNCLTWSAPVSSTGPSGFCKAWCESLHSGVAKKIHCPQAGKESQNPIDADSELTHVSESSRHVRFASA